MVYLEALLRYLSDESMHKLQKRLKTSEGNLVICDATITPQQNNSYHCGVFITMYPEFLLDNIPLTKLKQSDIISFRKKFVCILQRETTFLCYLINHFLI